MHGGCNNYNYNRCIVAIITMIILTDAWLAVVTIGGMSEQLLENNSLNQSDYISSFFVSVFASFFFYYYLSIIYHLTKTVFCRKRLCFIVSLCFFVCVSTFP